VDVGATQLTAQIKRRRRLMRGILRIPRPTNFAANIRTRWHTCRITPRQPVKVAAAGVCRNFQRREVRLTRDPCITALDLSNIKLGSYCSCRVFIVLQGADPRGAGVRPPIFGKVDFFTLYTMSEKIFLKLNFDFIVARIRGVLLEVWEVYACVCVSV